jgi:hypothetical protein
MTEDAESLDWLTGQISEPSRLQSIQYGIQVGEFKAECIVAEGVLLRERLEVVAYPATRKIERDNRAADLCSQSPTGKRKESPVFESLESVADNYCRPGKIDIR